MWFIIPLPREFFGSNPWRCSPCNFRGYCIGDRNLFLRIFEGHMKLGKILVDRLSCFQFGDFLHRGPGSLSLRCGILELDRAMMHPQAVYLYKVKTPTLNIRDFKHSNPYIYNIQQTSVVFKTWYIKTKTRSIYEKWYQMILVFPHVHPPYLRCWSQGWAPCGAWSWSSSSGALGCSGHPEAVTRWFFHHVGLSENVGLIFPMK